MRTPMHLTRNPDEAARIAAHTAGVLADMRCEANLQAHRARYVGWLEWADKNHVCKTIRSHVIGVNAEVDRELKAAHKLRNTGGGQ